MIYGSVSTGSHCEQLVFEGELGWECAFVSEIDKYANQVIRYHAPETPNLGDFSKIEANERTTRIQLLCGGTPCQDFSVAGLRAGLAGERGGLSVEFLKLVARLRPTWFLWENVPGVFSSWHAEEKIPVLVQGRDGTHSILSGGNGAPRASEAEVAWEADERNAFDQFLGGIRHIGYQFAWRCFDAQYFGVPQRRRRVFVVGHLGDWRRAAAVLLERESMSGHPAPSQEAGTGTTQALTRGFANGGADDNKAQRGFLVPFIASREVSQALTSNYGKQPDNSDTSEGPTLAIQCVTGDKTHALRAEGADAGEDGTGRGTPIVAFNGRQDPCPSDHSAGALDEDGSSQCIAQGVSLRGRDGGGTAELSGDLSTAIRSSSGGGDKPHVLAFSSKDHGADAGETAPTLRSMNNRESNVNGGGQVAVAFRETTDTVNAAYGTKWNGNAAADNGSLYAKQNMRVRRLMPVECERLQGWLDGWTRFGLTKAAMRWERWNEYVQLATALDTGEADPVIATELAAAMIEAGYLVEISDTQRYKIIGNGWALPVVRWIAQRIDRINAI